MTRTLYSQRTMNPGPLEFQGPSQTIESMLGNEFMALLSGPWR